MEVNRFFFLPSYQRCFAICCGLLSTLAAATTGCRMGWVVNPVPVGGWPQAKVFAAWPIERTDASMLELGKTTWSDVEERFGKCGPSPVFPQEYLSEKCAEYPVKPDFKLAKGRRDGESHAREGQLFFFEEELLVGQAYYSSHASNHTDFDESLISSIVKGQTTREDVLKLVGQANGTCLSDADLPGQPTGLQYLYISRHDKVGLPVSRWHMKWLTIEFANGVASEVRYREGKSNANLSIDTGKNDLPDGADSAVMSVASDTQQLRSANESD